MRKVARWIHRYAIPQGSGLILASVALMLLQRSGWIIALLTEAVQLFALLAGLVLLAIGMRQRWAKWVFSLTATALVMWALGGSIGSFPGDPDVVTTQPSGPASLRVNQYGNGVNAHHVFTLERSFGPVTHIVPIGCLDDSTQEFYSARWTDGGHITIVGSPPKAEAGGEISAVIAVDANGAITGATDPDRLLAHCHPSVTDK